MAKADKIIIDGIVSDPSALSVGVEELLSSNFVYQRIHAMNHLPLYPDMILEMAGNSLSELYCAKLPITKEQLTQAVSDVLKQNNYPSRGSNLLTLYLFPHNSISYMLCVTSQLLYRGFTIWHTPQKAAVVQYETPFPRHKTGVSLMTHNYAIEFVKRDGMDIALTESIEGVITGAGEYPLFAVTGNIIAVSPIKEGAAESAERNICIWACRQAGYEVVEQSVKTSMLDKYDELFYFAPQGIYPIRSCAGNMYPDIVSRRVASVLNHIDKS